MTIQSEALTKYCEKHGHTPDAGGKFCLNCAAPVIAAPAAEVVPAGTLDPKDGQEVSKATNPKDAIGATKLPISWVPTAVNRYAALAFAEGALKYGRYNWRVAGVRISIYLDALHRHLMKLQDGEWCDGDSLGPDAEGNPQGTQVPHLGSIIACAGIILDSWECDKLTDDRPPVNINTSADMDSRVAHIAYLKKMFAEFHPHQNVITDATREG